MKHSVHFFVASAVLGAMLLCADTLSACTNFLVGKQASVDGSVMITYAMDSYSQYGYLDFSPAADHPQGSMRAIVDGDTGKPLGEIPQVAHTYSVVGYTNEHQVAVTETTWGGREACWDTVGIDYVSLMQIALERSRTAREALDMMVALVAQYGYASEGESFSIADTTEVWLMEMTGKGGKEKGAVWVATRIPDDCISAHANQARTQQLPLKGSKYDKKKGYCISKDGTVLWSKDVISFARKNGFFAGEDADFSFAQVYNPYEFSGLYVCEARVWSFFRKFNADIERYFDYASGKTFFATNGKDAGEPMPLYIRPNHKVSAQELKECMRDQYEGTPLDITQGPVAGPWHSKLRYGGLTFQLDSVPYWYERPTATQQTGSSYVAQLRQGKEGILWFGVDDAATSLYVPIYCRVNAIPECYRLGNGDLYTYSPTAAWWTFNIVANWVYTKYDRMIVDLKRVRSVWEDKFNSQVAVVDAQVAQMDDAACRDFLTRYSVAQAEESHQAWKELQIYLFTKYLDGVERKEENGAFKRNQWGNPDGPNRHAYPETYLRHISSVVAHE
ncbi:MAG: C69 family dipeptidase [Paludibacteraceae bacterium]|nr:C69 family dipeptidase [Paludibacteraceae bacterium]